MSVREKDNPEFFARIQEQNLLRQYDLLTNCIEIGLKKGIEAFDKYTLWSLNAAAVANIAQFGGRFREQPIYVRDHIPPHFEKVPNLMDQFISLVHEDWTIIDHPTILPAYALWRMNWIHPFVEGVMVARHVPHATICSVCGSAEFCLETRSFRSEYARTGHHTMMRYLKQTGIGPMATLMFLPLRPISKTF